MAIQNRQHGMPTSDVVLLHDNAHLHTSMAARTEALLKHFNWELFDHPPYSPDLAPNDCHLFTYLNNWLPSHRFNNNEELMADVKTGLSSQASNFFHTSIQKLTAQYDKCLNSSGDYVEKQLKYVRIFLYTINSFSHCLFY
jgi:histone-lysine N-methyltransferase SETMAR